MSDLAEMYRNEGYWTDRQLTDFFESAVAATPNKVFVKDDRFGAFTYGELSPKVLKLASALQQRGIVRGDRFVIALPNWYHAPVFALALNYLGAVCVHMPATGGPHEFSGVLKVSGAKGIVTPRTFGSSNYVEMINGLADDLDNLELCISVGDDPIDENWLSYDSLLANAPDNAPDLSNRATPDDITALLFTSGSSGDPKGVIHSSTSLTSFNTTVYPIFDFGPDDIIFMGAPLGFSAGLIHGLRLAVVLGCTLILQEAWNSEKALETMATEKATFSLTTPTLLHDMFQSPAFAEFGHKICLKLMLCGGMYVPAPLLEEARKRWPNTLTSVIWGMTEGIGTSSRFDTPADKVISTDGRPFLGTELRILDENSEDAAPGEQGDLVMRGPQLFLGYFNRPELDDIAFLNNETGRWFYTGDVGTIDADGYLKLTGRKKELIIRGGANLSPSEIEEKLSGDPRISKMLVVGIPDERLGERVCACVIPSEGNGNFCLDDLLEVAKSSGLSKAKWPERLEIIDMLPTTSAGKIQRHVLQERICNIVIAENAAAEGE
ncbi:MAG: AMP-binding protein [Rhodospirillales bacterium]|nr:AMP-binding protein [Rhodospirillales bacterium]